jgi:hypothetical protein
MNVINGIKHSKRSYESQSTVLHRKAASHCHLLLKGSDTYYAKQRFPFLHRFYNVTSCRDRGKCRVDRSTAQHEGRKVRAGPLRALASGLENNLYGK